MESNQNKELLMKKILEQKKIEQDDMSSQNDKETQKILNLQKKIEAQKTLKKDFIEKLRNLENQKNLAYQKIKLFQHNLENINVYEKKIMEINNEILKNQKEKTTKEDELNTLSNLNKNIINQKIENKRMEIQKLYEFLDLNYDTLSKFKIGSTHYKVKIQKQYENYQDELEKLKLEFKINGNSRLLDRNSNIQNIIHYQNTFRSSNNKINTLEKELTELNQNLEKYTRQRKKEYETLLSMNNKKLKNLRNETKLPTQNIYLECKNLQDSFNQTTKNETQKLRKKIELCKFNISQKKIELSKIRVCRKKDNKQHHNTLQKIKDIRLKISKLGVEQQIFLIKDENQRKQQLTKIISIKDKIKSLENEINNKISVVPLLKDKISAILTLGLEIKLAQKNKIFYEENIKKSYSNNTELITLFQEEIVKLDKEIKQQNKFITDLENKIIMLEEKEKYQSQKHRLNKEKYIKDNNKKIIQELSSLSNLIV